MSPLLTPTYAGALVQMKKGLFLSYWWTLALPIAAVTVVTVRAHPSPPSVNLGAKPGISTSAKVEPRMTPVRSSGPTSTAPKPADIARTTGAVGQSSVLLAGSPALLVDGLDPSTAASNQDFAAIEQQASDGDVGPAEARLRQLAGGTDLAVAARAQFLLARMYLMNGDTANGQRAFQDFLTRFASQPEAPLAHFALGEIAYQQGQRDQAASELREYLKSTLDHSLDGYADFDLARISQDSGDRSGAISLFQSAVEAGVPLSEDLTASSAVGQAMLASGHASDAAKWYGTLAARPSNDPTSRAHYEFLEATALVQSGDEPAAATIFRSLLQDDANGADMGATVNALKSLGQSIGDFEAGEAYLHARQYGAAVQSLGVYLDRNPQGSDAATARYDRGVALIDQNDGATAAAQLDRFVSLYPGDGRLGAAVLLEGKALNVAGNWNQAVKLLLGFVAQHPTDASAPQALADAVQYLKSASQDTTALQVEQQLIATFPNSPLMPTAAFDVGWADYERLDFAAARSVWQSVLNRWPTNPRSSPSLLWLGKLEQRSGNTAAAQRDFQLAWQANPGDYYAFRAHDLEVDAASQNYSVLVEPSPTELAQEQSDLESWLATWTNPTDVERDLPYLGAPISRGSTLNRISALAAIGLQDDLQNEIKQAMGQYSSDGRSLFALADTLDRAGLTTDALTAAYQLLMISPAPNAYQSPRLLQRLVYPFLYRDLITQSAQKYGVDPLLLVSLIRQESAFNPRAHSVTGALGLTQFEPGTAQGVAARIGLKDFTLDQLYQPRVAIELGAAYLAGQTKAFGGNPIFALAAYNAGAGSLQSWLSDNPRQDLDLLVEEIPFQQTNDYVRNIYRFYDEYRFVYRSSPGK